MPKYRRRLPMTKLLSLAEYKKLESLAQDKDELQTEINAMKEARKSYVELVEKLDKENKQLKRDLEVASNPEAIYLYAKADARDEIRTLKAEVERLKGLVLRARNIIRQAIEKQYLVGTNISIENQWLSDVEALEKGDGLK